MEQKGTCLATGGVLLNLSRSRLISPLIHTKTSQAITLKCFFFSRKNDKENETPVPKYKRDLVHKLKILKQDFQALQPQGGHCRLEVSREEIFEVGDASNCTTCYVLPI